VIAAVILLIPCWAILASRHGQAPPVKPKDQDVSADVRVTLINEVQNRSGGDLGGEGFCELIRLGLGVERHMK
jgi:hypothetical protein